MAKIACSPATWTDVTFERLLDAVADLGYAGIEANREATEAFARQLPRLRGLLAERSLTLTAVPCIGTFFDRDTRADDLAELRRVGDFLAEVGGGGLVLFRTVRHTARRDMAAGQPPLLPLTSDRVARLADTLNELADRCRDYGLRAAVQNRVGTYIETPEEYREVVERTEPELVGLAPDLGHWAYAGGDVDDLIRVYRDRLVYPRLKGFDETVFRFVVAEHLAFRDFVQRGGFTPLGEGTLDLEAPLLRLERVDYAGWLCVELEPTSPGSADPRASAQASREYLRSRLHW